MPNDPPPVERLRELAEEWRRRSEHPLTTRYEALAIRSCCEDLEDLIGEEGTQPC